MGHGTRRILYLYFWCGGVFQVTARTTHSGAPHLLDSSLRCPRWIRQRVLDGRTVSRALARKHAARVSWSTFVPRVVSNAPVRVFRVVLSLERSPNKTWLFTVRKACSVENGRFSQIRRKSISCLISASEIENKRARAARGVWVSVNNRHSFLLSRSYLIFST